MKRLKTKIALFSGLIIFSAIIILCIPYSKKFAFHFIKGDCYNHGSWIYDRIVENQVPVDLAFIGSSHTIHAFQESIIEEELDNGYNVVNLGYCRYGRNLQYTILKELVRHKSPEIVVIEVHEDEEKNSHDIFPFIADTKDLLATPTFFNRDYFSDLFKGISTRLEALKATYIFNMKYPAINQQLHGYGRTNRTANKEELSNNHQKWIKRKTDLKSDFIRARQLRLPMAYLKEMKKMMDENEIELFFVYLPEFGSQLDTPMNSAYYTTLGTLLIPPSNILTETRNWMDEGHLNDQGAKLLSIWIAHELQQNCFADKTND